MKILKKIRFNSPVILTFSLIAFLAYVLGVATNGFLTTQLFSVYRSSFANPLTYIRVFTHVLGHASLEHFLNNFLIILLLGPMIEEKYGTKDLIIMICFTAVITGLVNIVFFPQLRLLGASGIVFMLILLSSFANYEKGTIPLTLILCIIFYLGKEISQGILVSDNISQISHIIGGLCGAGFGFFLNSSKQK